MKFAWIEDGKVRDVCPGNPASSYTPEVAKYYDTAVPDYAKNGDGWDGKTLAPAPVPEPPPPVAAPIVLSPIQFKLLFTLLELAAIRKASADDAVLTEALNILDDIRLAEINMASRMVKTAVGYLVDKALITTERAVQVLAGEEPA